MDRFVKHILKPQFYLRYGDDFIIITSDKIILENIRAQTILFLSSSLGLKINYKNDIILPVRKGIHFLGVEIFPTGRRLKAKNWCRVKARLNQRNVASYYGLIDQHQQKKLGYFNWLVKEMNEYVE